VVVCSTSVVNSDHVMPVWVWGALVLSTLEEEWRLEEEEDRRRSVEDDEECEVDGRVDFCRHHCWATASYKPV
jgi:hypothetical protein